MQLELFYDAPNFEETKSLPKQLKNGESLN